MDTAFPYAEISKLTGSDISNACLLFVKPLDSLNSMDRVQLISLRDDKKCSKPSPWLESLNAPRSPNPPLCSGPTKNKSWIISVFSNYADAISQQCSKARAFPSDPSGLDFSTLPADPWPWVKARIRVHDKLRYRKEASFDGKDPKQLAFACIRRIH
ncbi:hypothetical protein F2Q69_00041008 [Brassica cretica]|uniref:Uncharacterized protein n=1 Tax=Brassica cretica TaxID=69181 RepID=A0A8S9NMG2_BRACR|nr:hypothetical protein F2Q69_00041008 [Brassica cretica]